MTLEDYIAKYGENPGIEKFIEEVLNKKPAESNPRPWRAIRVYGDRDDVEVVEM